MSQPSKRITFVRHGESESNAGGITMPHDAIPLSALGRRQAVALANALNVKPSAVFVSRFTRTHETAAPFCKRYGVTPQIHHGLHEFSVIDPALIEGLNGDQRKPFVKNYWDDPDPHRRLGQNADTFVEFEARVRSFMANMEAMPDGVVVFGHGIWFGLLNWLSLGYRVRDASEMRAFRRFQQALPMPNCATFTLTHAGGPRWSIQADTGLMHRISAVKIEG